LRGRDIQGFTRADFLKDAVLKVHKVGG